MSGVAFYASVGKNVPLIPIYVNRIPRRREKKTTQKVEARSADQKKQERIATARQKVPLCPGLRQEGREESQLPSAPRLVGTPSLFALILLTWELAEYYTKLLG